MPTAWRRGENNPDFIFRSLAFKLVLGSNSQLTRKNDFVITRQETVQTAAGHYSLFGTIYKDLSYAYVGRRRRR